GSGRWPRQGLHDAEWITSARAPPASTWDRSRVTAVSTASVGDVASEQVVEIVRVLFLFGEDRLHHDAGRRIIGAEPADDFLVGDDHDTFRLEVLPQHAGEILVFIADVLRVRTAGSGFGTHVRLPAQLAHAFGSLQHVLAFLFG